MSPESADDGVMLQRLYVAAVCGQAPPDVIHWAWTKIAAGQPSWWQRHQRDEHLRLAATRLPGSPYAKSQQLLEVIARLKRSRRQYERGDLEWHILEAARYWRLPTTWQQLQAIVVSRSQIHPGTDL